MMNIFIRSVKKNRMALVLLGIASNVAASCTTECPIGAHTTFVPRKMSQNSVLELGLTDYFEYHRHQEDDCSPWSLEVVAPYYFKSTRSKELAHYFLPHCQDCITIGENNISTISSPWLELITPIATPYQSTVCLRPTREVIGGAIRLFCNLDSLLERCGCNNRRAWLSIFVPIQEVRHRLGITEIPSSVPGTFDGIHTAIEALNNPAWQFGKWSPHTLKKRGIDDICIKLGVNLTEYEQSWTDLYGMLFVPTGRGTKARYLFEPLVGGNHVGAGLGINTDHTLYDCGNTSIDLLLDVRYAYFFKHRETRSIDLFNGDLTRYLLVVRPNTPEAPNNTVLPLPGINFFTLRPEVTPRSMLEVWAALSFNHCNYHVEVGYDFWLRSKEKMDLSDRDLGVGIFDIAQRSNVTGVCPVTASCARICQAVPEPDPAPVSDLAFTSVKYIKSTANSTTLVARSSADALRCESFCASPERCSLLNLNSAAHPRALSSTVYAALSYDACLCCNYPVMIGIGGQYEFAHSRNALSQYGVWLKSAISF